MFHSPHIINRWYLQLIYDCFALEMRLFAYCWIQGFIINEWDDLPDQNNTWHFAKKHYNSVLILKLSFKVDWFYYHFRKILRLFEISNKSKLRLLFLHFYGESDKTMYYLFFYEQEQYKRGQNYLRHNFSLFSYPSHRPFFEQGWNPTNMNCPSIALVIVFLNFWLLDLDVRSQPKTNL